MSETRVRIGSAGRFVIPAEFREALGIHAGDEVVLVLDPGEIRLMTTRQAVKRAQALVRQRSRGQVSLADELVAERREEARRE